MLKEEKTMKSEKVYEGKVLNLKIDTVELPDKGYSKREIVEHPGGVAIITITANREMVLVKQYRKAVEDFVLEIQLVSWRSMRNLGDCYQGVKGRNIPRG